MLDEGELGKRREKKRIAAQSAKFLYQRKVGRAGYVTRSVGKSGRDVTCSRVRSRAQAATAAK